MKKNKAKLTSWLVQIVLVAVVTVLVYNGIVGKMDLNRIDHAVYRDVPAAWNVRCWSDALFIPAVVWVSIGGLVWVSTTGFFDIFRYGFSSLLVLFTPFKNPRDHKKFYEYKLEREEKRKGRVVPVTILAIGAVLLIGSAALSFVHEDMVEPYRVDYTQVTTSPQGGSDADTTGGNFE